MDENDVYVIIWRATFLNAKGDITHSESGMILGCPDSGEELVEYILKIHDRENDVSIRYSATRLLCSDEEE